jgi:FkbM family methyltransferase
MIYDVGMHDGTDTAFYLHQGHRVLAIEADPALAAAGAQRFSAAVARGQLQILNVGIAEQTGTAAFWICEDHSVWNSFDRAVASRNGSRCHQVTIPTMRFADILAQHGVPMYLKIDIEGADAFCVRDLPPGRLPHFISVESECVGDDDALDAAGALCMLDLLRDAGYTRFKMVSQDDFSTAGDWTWRGRGGRRLLDWRLRRRNAGYRFQIGSSGPWGEGLLGRWSTYAAARARYLSLRERFFASPGVKSYAFWYDWHATY